jgi:hypothetical protein
MPENSPAVGEVVLWYPDCDRGAEPLAALVTGSGETLNLNIFDRSSYNLRVRDGVRHAADPRSQNPAARESGSWDWHPLSLLVRRLADEVAQLRAALAAQAPKKGA